MQAALVGAGFQVALDAARAVDGPSGRAADGHLAITHSTNNTLLRKVWDTRGSVWSDRGMSLMSVRDLKALGLTEDITGRDDEELAVVCMACPRVFYKDKLSDYNPINIHIATQKHAKASTSTQVVVDSSLETPRKSSPSQRK